MTFRSVFLLALASSAVPFMHASADACANGANHCLTQDVSYEWSSPNGLNVMLDTNWVPSGSPLQVRLYLAATGYSEVVLAGDAGASWPAPITFGYSPGPAQSHVTIDYGFELRMQFRFSIRVLGETYGWTGDIPIPGLPGDLRMMATKTFDTFALLGAPNSPVGVADATGNIRVVDVNVLGSIIPIPGLSGGIALDVRANLDAQYQTNRISVQSGTPPLLTTEGQSTNRRPQAGSDYGAALDVATRPQGAIGQVFSVVLTPTFYVDLFGLVDYSVDLFEIPLEVLNNTTTVAFPERILHYPLADIVVGEDVDFGTVALGGTKQATLGVMNEGEADLELMITSLPEGVIAESDSMVLGSGQADALLLTFTGNMPGPFEEDLVFTTNDPDMPEVRVALGARVLMQGELPEGDGGVDGSVDGGYEDGGMTSGLDGGCGCRAQGGESQSAAPFLALALGLGLVIRRRQRL